MGRERHHCMTPLPQPEPIFAVGQTVTVAGQTSRSIHGPIMTVVKVYRNAVDMPENLQGVSNVSYLGHTYAVVWWSPSAQGWARDWFPEAALERVYGDS